MLLQNKQPQTLQVDGGARFLKNLCAVFYRRELPGFKGILVCISKQNHSYSRLITSPKASQMRDTELKPTSEKHFPPLQSSKGGKGIPSKTKHFPVSPGGRKCQNCVTATLCCP
uniref:Uncharacterized protein n=1 Tax=Sphaerodactylus townsendi TaxID=933632 RepID=A0ACB8FVM0_9SAUR